VSQIIVEKVIGVLNAVYKYQDKNVIKQFSISFLTVSCSLFKFQFLCKNFNFNNVNIV